MLLKNPSGKFFNTQTGGFEEQQAMRCKMVFFRAVVLFFAFGLGSGTGTADDSKAYPIPLLRLANSNVTIGTSEPLDSHQDGNNTTLAEPGYRERNFSNVESYENAAPNGDSDKQRRGQREASLQFKIIVASVTTLGGLAIVTIILLVIRARRPRVRQRKDIFHMTVKHTEEEADVHDLLLKKSEFQSITGCSSYLVQEDIYTRSLPRHKEIQRASVEFGTRIGGGKFGEVFQGRIIEPITSSTQQSPLRPHIGQPVFIEILTHGAALETVMQFHDVIRELEVLNHPNISRLLAVQTKAEPFFLLTENLAENRLDAVLRGLNKDQTLRKSDWLRAIASQMASALSYLSSVRVVHRDISARNVLYRDGDGVKLTHNAAACAVYHDCYYYMNQGKCLYPLRWMAPESVVELTFSSQSDVWSYGVFLWELYSFGDRPFPNKSHKEVRQDLHMVFSKDVVDKDFLSKPSGCPHDIYSVMRRCWRPQPRDRILSHQIAELIKS